MGDLELGDCVQVIQGPLRVGWVYHRRGVNTGMCPYPITAGATLTEQYEWLTLLRKINRNI